MFSVFPGTSFKLGELRVGQCRQFTNVSTLTMLQYSFVSVSLSYSPTDSASALRISAIRGAGELAIYALRAYESVSGMAAERAVSGRRPVMKRGRSCILYVVFL